MKVQLNLWADQSGIDANEIGTSSWEMLVNGQPFPSGANIFTLEQAHWVAIKLCEIEDQVAKWNGS